MRELFLILNVVLLTSCSYERVFIGDVDKLTNNQIANNKIEIDGLKKELKDAKLNVLKENTALTDKLDNLHKSILELNDSLDSFDKRIATMKVNDFTRKNFQEVISFNQVPFAIDEDTPRPLMKLHLAMLEAFLIRQEKDNVQGEATRLDHLALRIVPSKTIVKKGEKVIGEITICAEANFEDTKKAFQKMVLNGQQIYADNDGWKFEIQPNVRGSGLVNYELHCELFFRDPKIKTKIEGTQTVYVEN